MPRCPRCSNDAPDASRFCPSCGGTMTPLSSAPTQTHLENESLTHSSLDSTRFAPGDVLARRYRIVALLGRGGMGEVYRADDLKLGQPVALKFLPAELEQDKKRLERFLNEVRIARQVSHPNVCRVYDVAETDRQHFLSMEYVDGEDLASLLRRIGRLPEDKAVQLARQICAGLAAAHQQGILHRDLKPANVMIDGRGRARMTDFGLAGLAESFEGADITAGTPAYMSPEQLEGREVTQRSDIYALGLVLYELFTGKPAFATDSLTQLRQARQLSTPTDPSSLVKGLDSAIETVILRCLDPDPAKRPPDALGVSAALPGGDPLAAALAAGETPSPEMVAAAGGVGGLKLPIAFALFAGLLLGLFGIVLTHGMVALPAQIDLPESADALVFQARQIIRDAGYTDPPMDRAHGFVYDADRLRHVRENEGAPSDWSSLTEQQPDPITFWYRESPRYMAPVDFNALAVTENDPQPVVAGMLGVRLDPRGRLLRFHTVLAASDDDTQPVTEPDWSLLIEYSGLEPETLAPTTPRWLPPDYCDTRSAWTGSYPDQPDAPVRIEAGAYRGQPVYFELALPWSRAQQVAPGREASFIEVFSFVFLLLLIVGAVVLARINVRLGRGDPKGAFRLALFIAFCQAGAAIFASHHVPTFAETELFFKALARVMMVGGVVWIGYIALEPYARRLWPDILISWSRLLAGRVRDPLIGRDVLIGGLIGIAVVLVRRLMYVLPTWLDLPLHEPLAHPVGGFQNGALVTLESTRHAMAMIFHVPDLVVTNALASVFMLVLIRLVVRKPWIAVLLTGLFFMTTGAMTATNLAIDLPIVTIGVAAWMGVLIRSGLLASAAFILVVMIDQFAVLTLDFSNWYAGRSFVFLSLVVAVFGYAFYISLGGKRVLPQSG